MGKNKLGRLLREITSDANLEGRFTNHAVRKTGITNLLHAGVPTNLVQQVSGHKSIESLKNYASASTEKIVASVGNRTEPTVCYENQQMSISFDEQKENAGVIRKSSNASMVSGIFSGANLSGCTFNIMTKQN